MAIRLNNLPRPVGNAVRYVRTGARLLRRTVTNKGRTVAIRFNHESVGVAQPQPQTQQTRDSQLNHVAGAETNTNSHVISNPLTLSTNDSNGTSASTQESTFICTEYELDLVLSVALVGDKEQYAYDQAGVTATTDNTEPVRADSQTQNDERLSNSGSSTSVAITIYNSLKSTKARIDNFVKWYRRELERRNLI